MGERKEEGEGDTGIGGKGGEKIRLGGRREKEQDEKIGKEQKGSKCASRDVKWKEARRKGRRG